MPDWKKEIRLSDLFSGTLLLSATLRRLLRRPLENRGRAGCRGIAERMEEGEIRLSGLFKRKGQGAASPRPGSATGRGSLPDPPSSGASETPSPGMLKKEIRLTNLFRRKRGEAGADRSEPDPADEAARMSKWKKELRLSDLFRGRGRAHIPDVPPDPPEDSVELGFSLAERLGSDAEPESDPVTSEADWSAPSEAQPPPKPVAPDAPGHDLGTAPAWTEPAASSEFDDTSSRSGATPPSEPERVRIDPAELSGPSGGQQPPAPEGTEPTAPPAFGTLPDAGENPADHGGGVVPDGTHADAIDGHR